MRTEVYQRFHSMRQVLTALHSVGSVHEAQLRLAHETELFEVTGWMRFDNMTDLVLVR